MALKAIRHTLQHHLNSLHIYSFICSMNICREKALKTANAYERVMHPLLYIRRSP